MSLKSLKLKVFKSESLRSLAMLSQDGDLSVKDLAIVTSVVSEAEGHLW